ncbi:hypothetical protein ABVV53_01565 [Novosphingobium sp. RD2P27]|uniref:Uncharacterized protein n=1 Tax=Novosphingobium kalidii TaxID=3230299 RepID=A0ABV2CXL8_9SPHN
MGTWKLLLGGFLAWTAHFFGVYAAASLFPGSAVARWLVLAITVAALAAVGWLFWHALGIVRAAGTDDLNRWLAWIAVAGATMAGISILYQSSPAFLI